MAQFSFDSLDVGQMVDTARDLYWAADADAHNNPSQAAFTRAANAQKALNKAEDMASVLYKVLSGDTL